jgi:hypothetical protein
MLFMLLLLIFLGVGAAIWFHGLWSSAITVVNLILSMLIATNYYEPTADLIESLEPSYSHLYDVLALWLLFIISFGILRGISDAISSNKIEFSLPVEMTGRSLLAIWASWLIICFIAFTLHIAPLNSVTPLGAYNTPSEGIFLGQQPDHLWLGFFQQSSRGSFAGSQEFDTDGVFLYKYHKRRALYAAQPGMAK